MQNSYKTRVGIQQVIPLQAKQVREVANLTERKNPHTPVYGVKEYYKDKMWNLLYLSVYHRAT